MSDRPLSERIRDLIVWFDPEFSPQAQAVNGLANEVRDLESLSPQIIRTVEELEALDPDTLLIDRDGEESFAFRMQASIRNLSTESMYHDSFPAVVITPAEQVRAARKALEDA